MSFNPLAANRQVFTSGVSANQQLTLLALIDHMPNCRPSITRLAAWTKLSERAVFRALTELEKAGAIVVHRAPGRRSSYDLDLAKLPPGTPDCESPLTVSHPCPAVSPPLTVSQSTPDCESPKVTKEVTNFQTRTAASSSGGDDSSASKPQNAKPPKAEGKHQPKAKPAAKAPTDPRVIPTIDAYHQTYQRTVGHAPSGTDYGRAGKQIQRLPPRVTVETLRKAIRLQLEERRGLEYTRGADWVTLPQIVSNLDEILAWKPRKANGHARQPEPECNAAGYRPA